VKGRRGGGRKNEPVRGKNSLTEKGGFEKVNKKIPALSLRQGWGGKRETLPPAACLTKNLERCLTPKAERDTREFGREKTLRIWLQVAEHSHGGVRKARAPRAGRKLNGGNHEETSRSTRERGGAGGKERTWREIAGKNRLTSNRPCSKKREGRIENGAHIRW